LVKLGLIALDGTKIKVNASKHKTMSYGRMVTEEARLQAEIERLLTQAEAADVRDDAAYGPDHRGDELPTRLARWEQRLETILATKTVLEQEDQAEASTPSRPARGLIRMHWAHRFCGQTLHKRS